MGVLSELEPKEVFQYFEDLCGIPHGSYHEAELSDYCVAFAKEHHLEVIQDELKNVIIIKPATAGYEQVPTLILQGHLDMVCEKTEDCKIDFQTDGLELEVEGDYISAKGTTLGGDDGIAVAYALAILASDTLKHPRLEVVLTIAEEVGMEGAARIDLSSLQGKKLLNMDSENEGILLTSCAGGAGVSAVLPIARAEKTGILYEIHLDHLTGGHSGVEIDKGRANANVLMGRILLSCRKQLPYDLVDINGGLKDNAIPRSCVARILIAPDNEKKLEEVIERESKNVCHEYRNADPAMSLQAVKCTATQLQALEETDKTTLLMLMNALPNGIQTMSLNIEGLVETSLNMGILKTEETTVTMSYAVRSSVSTAREALTEKMQAIIEYMGASFTIAGVYPGWAFKEDSKLREDMITVYEKMYGNKPKIEAVHAGVECGLLSDKIEGLDCISIGPDMKNIHTAQEQLCISSAKRVWEYIVQVIAYK
ncbi:MAG: aminoacyl-histidine dipeptidase [Lachnospiraceae bacterium]